MDNEIVSRLGQRLIDKNLARVEANINMSEVLEGGKVAIIVASLNRPTFTRAEAEEALAAALKNEASIIPDSFRILEGTGNQPVLCGFVVANTHTEALTDERRGRMKEMAKNVLMDTADESLWSVSEDGGSITKSGHEDLSELLAHVEVAAPRVNRYFKGNIPVHANEFVGFVDSEEGKLKFGMVLAHQGENPIVFCMADDAMYEISSNCIAHVRRTNAEHPVQAGLREVVTAAGGVDQFGPQTVNDILGYYKKVYAASPEYFSHLSDLVRKMGAL